MKFIPRRRLVLSSGYTSNSEAHWPSSQMPWDAEEAASAEVAQELDWSSQLASYTQEATLRADLSDDMRAEHPNGFVSTHTEDQLKGAQADEGATQPAQQPAYQLVKPGQQCQIALPVSEYTEVYNFLTKGTGLVQPASLQEGALYRLTDLRQVQL